MSEKIKLADLSTFNMAEALNTEEDIANYLTLALEEGNMSELNHALNVVARAQGVRQ